MVQKTTYADDEGLDFIDSLPTPEIKNTQELIAAATPAVEVAAPIVETPIGSRRGDVQQTSVVDNQGTVDVPKPDAILAYEQQFGTTMEPIYATRTRETRGGDAQVEYGPPIGYRFDNGKSQYENFDASGQHISTVDRGNNSGSVNFALSVLSLAYPPIAPFIQAYKAIEAIDKGDTLGFILNAAGAGKAIPGLDKSTVNMLKDVSTGARIIKAVESKDPLAIASSMVNLPGVPADLKNTLNIISTVKAVSKGDINALVGLAQKYGGDVSKTANKITLDGTTYDTNNTTAGIEDSELNAIVNWKPTDTSMEGGEQTAGLNTGVVSDAGGGRGSTQPQTRYVPVQNVDADNQEILNASDALSALIEKNGVQEGANIGPVLIRGENQDVLDADGEFVLNPDGTKQTELVFSYYSDIKLTDNQGNSTGYRALYDPVTGKTGYQLLTSDGETSTSRLTQTPPFFNVNTGRYTDEKPITQVLEDAGLVSDNSVDIIQELKTLTSEPPLATTDVAPLTTTDVDALTTTDVDALTTTDLTPLTTTDVDALTTTDLTPLTTTDLTPLTTTDVDALTATDLTPLTTTDLTPLTTTDLTPLTTTDVSGLTTTDVSGLSTAGVSGLSTAGVSGLSTAGVAPLTTTDVAPLTTTDVAPLTTTDVAPLTTTNNAEKPNARKALLIATKREPMDLRYDVNKDGKVTSADALSIAKGTPIRSDIDAFGAKLATADVSGLTTTDVSGLSTAGVGGLSTAGVSGLTTTDVGGLSTAGVSGLSTAGVSGLSTAGVSGLSTAGVSGLSTAGVSGLSTAGVSGLSTSGTGLSTQTIGTLGTKDIASLTTKGVATLTTKDLSALTTQDVGGLSTTDVGALTTKAVEALTTKAVVALPKLTGNTKTTTTGTSTTRKPTPSQAQRLADAFAVPTLANTFYGNADFSTKKVEVDDEGNIIEVPYEPIDVSKPASKSLLANGGQITDNSTNHLVALLNHIMGSQDRNQLTEDDLLNIVRKGI